MKVTGKVQSSVSAFRARLSLIIAALSVLLLQGCYYMQAAGGQMELWRKQRPVAEVVADPQTPAALAEQLMLLQQARQFAIDNMRLPDNGSYRQYADLGRDYVLWNVIAAPEFSLEPHRWCYFVVGCLAYRGYFSEDKAASYANKLEERGFDVFVAGVPAYSTLGKFSDPLLNTMMSRGDAELISLLFHELAHQRLYIDDDTGFNESFASAVAEFGVTEWFESRGEASPGERLRSYQAQTAAFMALIDETRSELQALYASDIAADQKRTQKMQLLDGLAEQVDGRWSGDWSAGSLNNARLATFSLYHGDMPAFRRMFENCKREWSCFYAEAERVAELEPVERAAALDSLAES